MKKNQTIILVLIVSFFSVVMLISMVRTFNQNQEATKDTVGRVKAGKEMQIKIDNLLLSK